MQPPHPAPNVAENTGYPIQISCVHRKKGMTVKKLIAPLFFRNATSSLSGVPLSPLPVSRGSPRGQDTLLGFLPDGEASYFLGPSIGGDLEESETILGEVGSARTTLNRSPDDTDVIFRP